MENEENQKPVSHRFPQPLEIPNDAIPTFPQPRRGAGKWKTKPQLSHFPACCLFFSERRPGARFAPLQAHRSIRKCYTKRVELCGRLASIHDSQERSHLVLHRKKLRDRTDAYSSMVAARLAEDFGG